MPFTPQQLSDAEDIKIVKHRYFRAIDTADAALLDSVFTDGVRVDYRGGAYRVNLQGKATMIDFLLTAFNSDCVAMHHGHMPEIKFISDSAAEGLWYLEDIFIARDQMKRTIGSAIYKDIYVKVNGEWRIAATEYDRVYEMIETLPEEQTITFSHLATHGRKPEERTDISGFITWSN